MSVSVMYYTQSQFEEVPRYSMWLQRCLAAITYILKVLFVLLFFHFNVIVYHSFYKFILQTSI